jgi:HPt (histidine-containing phosphotransfer) domain-containing protein
MDSRFIDEAAGISCSGGDRELYHQILETYYRGIPDLRRRITDNCRDDIADYTIAVHALKSSSRSIGALDLGETAYSCELAGKSGDREKIAVLTEELLSKLDGLMSELDREFSEERQGQESAVQQAAPADTENVMKIIETLKEAVRCFDSDEAEKMLGELEKFGFDGKMAETVSQCRDAMECFDYDGVMSGAAAMEGIMRQH